MNKIDSVGSSCHVNEQLLELQAYAIGVTIGSSCHVNEQLLELDVSIYLTVTGQAAM